MYVEEDALDTVKLHAGSRLDTMMRGNKPAKYATVTKITVKQENTKPKPGRRTRVTPQEIKKQMIAAAKATARYLSRYAKKYLNTIPGKYLKNN